MTTTPSTIPTNPGIYPDVPFDQYLSWPYASQSVLKKGRESAAHMKAAIDEDTTPSDDMLLGSALHCAFLEPELLLDSVAHWDRVTDSGNAKPRKSKEWDEFAGQHKGKLILNTPMYDKLQGMLKSLRKHPFVREWIGKIEMVEVSGISEWCGVKIKGRCDAFTTDPLVDLKKCQSNDLYLFQSNAFKYGYGIQRAVYRKVFNRDRFILLTIEDKPPYDVVPFEFDDDAAKQGEEEAMQLLGMYRHGMKTNEWPGKSDEIVRLGLPAYVKTEEEPTNVYAQDPELASL